MLYELYEIGFDTFVLTETELIETARFHCSSCEDRASYLPIENVVQAKRYFTENGFTVREVTP